MIKKQVGVFVVVFLLIGIVPISKTMNLNGFNDQQVILTEIDNVVNKQCVVDEVIGNVHVTYWRHVVNGVEVKNDSLLLQTSVDTGEIVKYAKSWSDVDVCLSNHSDEMFDLLNIFWKKPVVFADEKDCSYFYHFYDMVDYPLVCWEVRCKNGSTLMYSTNGKIIGYGIPAPSEHGFSISNDCGNGYGDCWSRWRQNADFWFQEWCDSTSSIGLPTVEEISSRVKNHTTTYFFELGHSVHLPTRFLVSDGIYYNASRLRSDMIDRQPMKFAFIGSCDGLQKVDSGTLSYEFRKGELNNTVTVGYSGMANCSGWVVSLDWQDFMFRQMDKGLPMKQAFDLACAEYPTIADCVRFVGDNHLVVGNNPPALPKKPIGDSCILPNELVSFTTSSFDSEGDLLSYLFDWGDGSQSDWLGPYTYNENVTCSHIWKDNGKYIVTVKAKDEHDVESNFSDSLSVTITNPPNKPETPTGWPIGFTKKKYTFTTSTIEPEKEKMYYKWDWGDGNQSDWLGPFSSEEKAHMTHEWNEKGNFDITVKAKDEHGAESEWSNSFVVTMPKGKESMFPLFSRLISWLNDQFPFFELIIEI